MANRRFGVADLARFEAQRADVWNRYSRWLRVFVLWASGDPQLTFWDENFLAWLRQAGERPLTATQRWHVDRIAAKLGYATDEPVRMPDADLEEDLDADIRDYDADPREHEWEAPVFLRSD